MFEMVPSSSSPLPGRERGGGGVGGIKLGGGWTGDGGSRRADGVEGSDAQFTAASADHNLHFNSI